MPFSCLVIQMINFLGRFLRSWAVYPVGFGVTAFSIRTWSKNRREAYSAEIGAPFVAADWQIDYFKTLPCRWISRGFGRICEVPLPTPVRPIVYSIYSRLTGVDQDEMAHDFDTYPCLTDFFTRSLKEGRRPVADSSLISPSDGLLSNYGRVESFQIEQVKNVTYCLKSFLGNISWQTGTNNNLSVQEMTGVVNKTIDVPDEDFEQFKQDLLHNPEINDLYHAVIYLAPGDYHRFHSPVDWKVNYRRHFTGQLLSVNPIFTRFIPGLFILNERVLYTGVWKHGFFSLTAVGAMNVGSIRIYSDPDLRTNLSKRVSKKTPRETELNLDWKKGEEIGEFRFGSTLVLIFEAPKNIKFDVERHSKVKVGIGLSE